MKFFDFSMPRSCQFSHSVNNTILRVLSFTLIVQQKSISLSNQLYQQENRVHFPCIISINKLTISIVARQEG